VYLETEKIPPMGKEKKAMNKVGEKGTTREEVVFISGIGSGQ